MSWQTMNKILTRAMVDPLFVSKLLVDPLKTVHQYGFEITQEEERILHGAKVKDISELSQLLLEQLKHESEEY
jgi:hypothetical protein